MEEKKKLFIAYGRSNNTVVFVSVFNDFDDAKKYCRTALNDKQVTYSEIQELTSPKFRFGENLFNNGIVIWNGIITNRGEVNCG